MHIHPDNWTLFRDMRSPFSRRPPLRRVRTIRFRLLLHRETAALGDGPWTIHRETVLSFTNDTPRVRRSLQQQRPHSIWRVTEVFGGVGGGFCDERECEIVHVRSPLDVGQVVQVFHLHSCAQWLLAVVAVLRIHVVWE